MREHVYKIKAKDFTLVALRWRNCKLQTYFIGNGLIDYFVVVDSSEGDRTLTAASNNALHPSTKGEKALFEQAEADY